MLAQLKKKLGLGPFSFWNLFIRKEDESVPPLRKTESMEVFNRLPVPQIKRSNSMDSMKKSTQKKSRPQSKKPHLLNLSQEEDLHRIINKETLSAKADNGDSSLVEEKIQDLVADQKQKQKNIPSDAIQQEQEEHFEAGMVTPPRRQRTMQIEEELLRPPRKCLNRSPSSGKQDFRMESPLFEPSLLLDFQNNCFAQQHFSNDITTPFRHLCLFSPVSEPFVSPKKSKQNDYKQQTKCPQSTIEKIVPSSMLKAYHPKPKCTYTRMCAICGQDAIIEYVTQACSHRVHNACRKAINVAKNNYKCQMCQRRRPRKFP